MKKILSLIIALIATFGVANAQDYMFVTRGGGAEVPIGTEVGNLISFQIEDIAEVQFNKVSEEKEGWTSLGYCLYGEDFLGSKFYYNVLGDACYEYYVEVQEKDDQPGLYRLVDAYSPDIYPLAAAYPEEAIYDRVNASHWYIEINATDPDFVYIELQDTGLSWYPYRRVYVYSGAAYYHYFGYSWDEIKEAGWGGTLKDGVITFGYYKLITLWPEYSYYCQAADLSEKFKVDLNDKSDRPGAKSAKYIEKRDTTSGESSHNGLQSDFTNEDFGEMKPYKKTK